MNNPPKSNSKRPSSHVDQSSSKKKKKKKIKTSTDKNTTTTSTSSSSAQPLTSSSSAAQPSTRTAPTSMKKLRNPNSLPQPKFTPPPSHLLPPPNQTYLSMEDKSFGAITNMYYKNALITESGGVLNDQVSENCVSSVLLRNSNTACFSRAVLVLVHFSPEHWRFFNTRHSARGKEGICGLVEDIRRTYARWRRRRNLQIPRLAHIRPPLER